MATARSNSLAEIAGVIRDAREVAVVSHYNPDADAYASSCAVVLALLAMGKRAVCVNESGVIPRFVFMPGVQEVVSEFPADLSELAIAVDCGDRKRIGDSLVAPFSGFRDTINIDHHSSNDHFAAHNYVVPEASSTSELILALLDELGVAVTPEIATCLFAGMAADTGSFRYSSTAPSTFRAAARLVEAGASPWSIGQEIFGNDSLAAVRAQAEALSTLELHGGGAVALVTVRSDMLARHGATQEDVEVLVERARDIAGVQVSACIRDADGIWRVSLRARKPEHDVAAVAQKFGGGGHRAAAGFRWRKGYDELKQMLTAELCGVVGRS